MIVLASELEFVLAKDPRQIVLILKGSGIFNGGRKPVGTPIADDAGVENRKPAIA